MEVSLARSDVLANLIAELSMSYADTIATFFKVLAAPGSTPEAHQLNSMMALFVQDGGGFPNVGLTTGGPQFTGRNAIQTLFGHLFTVFPAIVFAPANSLQLSSGNTVAVEAILNTGYQGAGQQWAPGGARSEPVSTVVPDGHHQSQLPACAVFTLNSTTAKINNLAIYFDRWQLAMDLWDRVNPPHIK
jgi:hypothetical protein